MSKQQQHRTISATPIKTSIFHSGESLLDFLVQSLHGVDLEGQVLAITSKIVSLAENRTVAKSTISKKDLIKKEADIYLTPGQYDIELTITKGLLIPSAGIDESNSADQSYILYPEDPFASAHLIWQGLRRAFALKNFGVILTDSHSMPLRRGVTGIALAYWGFNGVESLVDTPDLFGTKLKFTHLDIVDSLAAMAVLVMGEANESCPLAVVQGAKVTFSEVTDANELILSPQKDLYYPLLQKFIEPTKE